MKSSEHDLELTRRYLDGDSARGCGKLESDPWNRGKVMDSVKCTLDELFTKGKQAGNRFFVKTQYL
jgi:hypothetical protein